MPFQRKQKQARAFSVEQSLCTGGPMTGHWLWLLLVYTIQAQKVKVIQACVIPTSFSHLLLIGKYVKCFILVLLSAQSLAVYLFSHDFRSCLDR